MNNHFLTTKYFIKGKLFNLLEKIIPGNNDDQKIDFGSNYKLIKWVRSQEGADLTSVGFFIKNEKKVVIKVVRYKYKNLLYEQLINEKNMLSLMSDLSRKIKSGKINLVFPKVYGLISMPNQLALVTQFLSADSLKSKSSVRKIEILEQILSSFRKMSDLIDEDMLNKLPKRSCIQLLILFPIYLLKVIFADFKNIRIYLSLFFIFYKNYLRISNFNMKYILAHKDLHSENILINKNKVIIIDPEICVLADPNTDIAHIARYFSKELTDAEINNLLQVLLKSDNDKKNFLSLSIYYSLQMMAIRSKTDPDYEEARSYLINHFYKIKENLIKNEKLSPAEMVYFKLLQLISVINGVISLDNKKLPLILCYHGISDDGWRFSTKTKDFYSQIEFLKKHRRIFPLDKFLSLDSSLQKDAVSLTFDDGYSELVNLIPYFKKNKIIGTLFVLGNPLEANRDEIDNNKKLMGVTDILKFKKMGWEIGYHTKTHSDLSKLSKKELREEIILSKNRLEKKIGFKLNAFAYPRGIYSEEIINTVKEAGFKYAVTVDGGSYSPDDSVYLINRVSVEGNLDFKNFKSLISPLGIKFNSNFMSLLKIKNNLGL